MKERRQAPRVETDGAVQAKIKTTISARVVDISARGAQVEVQRSLPFRTTCDFKIQFRDGEIVLRATVRRCMIHGKGRDGRGREVMFYRAGLEFDRPTPGLAGLLGAKKRSPQAAGRATEDQPAPGLPDGAKGVLTLDAQDE